MMNTTEIEVNDNDAAPLSSVSPASSFRDSSPTHNKRRNEETNIKDAIDQIKFFLVNITYFAKYSSKLYDKKINSNMNYGGIGYNDWL